MPGTAVGDSGYLGRLELSAPEFKRFHSTGRFGVFLETGGTTLTTPGKGTPPWRTLSDVGLSLRLTLPYKFSATAMAAVPVERSGFTGVTKTSLRLSRLDAFFVIQKGF